MVTLFDDGTTIDGTSQRLSSGDTNPFGPEIVLDGSQAGASFGVLLQPFSSDNTIRGLVIHSFEQTGIQFITGAGGSADHNTITGCYIGTDDSGSGIKSNGWEGIAVNGVGNVIGGPDPGDGNLVAGNHLSEILIGDPNIPATNTLVQGNLVGTDRTGTLALGTLASATGLWLSGASGTTVLGNLISGNLRDGIAISHGTSDSLVRGNYIGTDPTGASSLPNGQNGIRMDASNNNRIEENVIAFNTATGIALQSGVNNAIRRNRIFSNGGLGIDLASVGLVNPNDPGDVDSGPNNRQNYPVLTSAHAAPGQLVVKGTIDTQNPRAITIEIFANPVPTPGGDPSGHGEGAMLLGTARPNQQGSFTATVASVPVGTLISATATDADGNTSEFAANIVASFQ